MRANLVAPGYSLDIVDWSIIPKDFTLSINFAHLICPFSNGVVCLDNHRYNFLQDVFGPGTDLYCYSPLPGNKEAFNTHEIKFPKMSWATFSASAALNYLGREGYKHITLIAFDIFDGEYRHAESLREYYPDVVLESKYWIDRILFEISDVVKYYDLEISRWKN